MDQIDGLCKVTFDKVDMYQPQRALANAMLIPSHASKVQHVQINEYLLTRNCMTVKNLHQFFTIIISI
jgi:hypothetical protein